MNNAPRDLALLIAEIAPEEMLIDLMAEQLAEYKKDNSEINKGRLTTTMVMFLSKLSAEKRKGGMQELMEEVQTREQRDKLFDTSAH